MNKIKIEKKQEAFRLEQIIIMHRVIRSIILVLSSYHFLTEYPANYSPYNSKSKRSIMKTYGTIACFPSQISCPNEVYSLFEVLSSTFLFGFFERGSGREQPLPGGKC